MWAAVSSTFAFASFVHKIETSNKNVTDMDPGKESVRMLMVLWFYGFMVLWFYGFMMLRLYGSMVLWFYGPMVV